MVEAERQDMLKSKDQVCPGGVGLGDVLKLPDNDMRIRRTANTRKEQQEYNEPFQFISDKQG